MRVLTDTSVFFRNSFGSVVAHTVLIPIKDAEFASTAPLVEIDEGEANEYGETVVQLRESERYEYEVVSHTAADLRLRCSLSSRRRSLGLGGEKPDSGLIETRSFCGTLLMELVEGEVTSFKSPVASALIDVRSLKLNYRTEYRGMLRRLSDEIAGLVADARSSAKVGYRSTFEVQTDASWFQIQLELLRDTLDSADFSAALQRILSFPHEQLTTVQESISTERPINWSPSAVRQLIVGNPRRKVPHPHYLHSQLRLTSIADRVFIPSKSRDLDTLENRFVKFSLGEFRAFLIHALRVFESSPGWGASAALSARLAATVEDWLGRSMFREVSTMSFAPLGSPVLQRKAGYRELLRWWLRFRTAAEITWEGGEEIFYAGQRDVASLYEYWLFFELLGWFCQKCKGGNRPAAEELVEGLQDGSPNLRLRKRMELGPFTGTFAGQSRRLNARFSYNRRFEVTQERHASGSWTRGLHPDYTLTFWPEELLEADAERQELLVHIHFDAKYRVEGIESLFGSDEAGDADDEVEGNYKRQDLLKMHAYRDAIKRSQGAYVLYPGRSNAEVKLKGFHEILPGLGAFGVAPNEWGEAQGFKPLERFLDEVLAHLGNRTTAQERVSFHIAESYTIKEEPVPYEALILPEQDDSTVSKRALPPSEHHVLIVCVETQEQLEWMLKNNTASVLLGNRSGSWLIPPEMASAKHILLQRLHGNSIDGLFRITKPGYRVFSGSDLAAKGYPVTLDGEIYAVFEIEIDSAYAGRMWENQEIIRQIDIFEARKPYQQSNVVLSSLYVPRVLSLQGLLSSMY